MHFILLFFLSVGRNFILVAERDVLVTFPSNSSAPLGGFPPGGW
jgi:hypothetical protein